MIDKIKEHIETIKRRQKEHQRLIDFHRVKAQTISDEISELQLLLDHLEREQTNIPYQATISVE